MTTTTRRTRPPGARPGRRAAPATTTATARSSSARHAGRTDTRPSAAPGGGAERAGVQAGRRAEELAARYLASLGYRLLGRNVFAGGGEIDIIARDGNVLVFVEVKARAGERHGAPEDAVTYAKRRRIRRAAAAWLGGQEPGSTGCAIRFDLVTVVPRSASAAVPGAPRDPSRANDEGWICVHTQDAFE